MLGRTFALSRHRTAVLAFAVLSCASRATAQSTFSQDVVVTAAATPVHEETNQTFVAADHRFGALSGWQIGGDLSYRTHGDHFLFDVRRPGVSENVHRTHATRGSLKASHSIGAETVVDGTNMFDAAYQEVLGVRMPGAAVSLSIAATLR